MNNVVIKKMESSYHMTEGIRTCRTNLLFSRDDRKVVVVTSTIAGEGKSSVAMELAMSLAQIDKKVILVDADLRKTVMVKRLMGVKGLKGLSHLLSGQAKLTEIIVGTNVKNMHLIIGGPTVLNAAELLSGNLFNKLIDALREHYDYVIIDGAPAGLVVDSAIIGEQADAAIFVVESGKVKYKAVQKAVATVEASGCPVLGVVLNKYEYKKIEGYYHKYYGSYGHEK